MINQTTAAKILQQTSKLWKEKVQTSSFLELTRGSERGHRIADYVGDVTASLLKTRFETRFQTSRVGIQRSRSMGDIWLRCGGIYNPINVKTGEFGKNGQPNIVSLKKLLRALLADQIDGYYLLIVKFNLGNPPSCHPYFIDLLEHLDFSTFDSGPGQMMLKERDFYAATSQGWKPGRLSLRKKIRVLFAKLEAGEKRLALNRKRDLDKLRQYYKAYRDHPKHTLDQSSLHLR